MDMTGANIIVLDLETLHSADDCRHCGKPGSDCHDIGSAEAHVFAKIGWDNKVALGLAIGCYWDYQDMALHFFDRSTLEPTMRLCVDRRPLLVSYNGLTFDFPLMRGLLRREADAGYDSQPERHAQLTALCNAFKVLCAQSYDILGEIWKADPASKRVRGLNGLDTVSQANGFGAKELDGSQAPRLWAQGRYAEVIGYCAGDVRRTRQLFEQLCETGTLCRGDAQPITLPRPPLPALLSTLRLQ